MGVARRSETQEDSPASECERIAAVLCGHPSIADCAVVERTAASGVAERLAYIVPVSAWSAQELRDRVRAAALTAPAQFVPVTAIPLTADGAVDVAALIRLPVADAALLDAWEQRASSTNGVVNAAAVLDAHLDRELPLHLSTLLPDWVRATVPADRPRTFGLRCDRGDGPIADALALVDGGSLTPDAGAPLPLGDALERAAATSANGIEYVGADGSVETQPYAVLLENATRILGGLQLAGLTPSARVVFQLERHQDFLELFWACVLGGFVPVPLAVPAGYDRPSPPLHTLERAWTALDTPHIVTARRASDALQAAADRLPLPGARVHAIEDLRTGALGRRRQCAADDLALLMLTSGSTGTPKAVKLTHRNIWSRTAGSRQLNGFSDRDVTLNWMPLDHVAGLIYFHLRDVYLGCRQIHVPTPAILADPLKWLDSLERFRVTVTFAPNFAFALVNDREREIATRTWDLSSVRFVLNGAEAIVARTARRFLALLAPHGLAPTAMHPAWGMSETSSGTIYGDRFSLATTTDDDPFVEVGRPVPTLSMRIVDGDDRVVHEGVVGRLQVSGAVVTSGYFGGPELTRESFTADGWFKTGDLGTIRHGRLTITGREKDVVIINSVNYYCHEIESVVEAIDGVETTLTAACPVRPDGANTDRLAIFFHPSNPPATPELLSRIRTAVTAKIGIAPDYLLPVDAAAIPKTSLGKIQRSELAMQFAAGEFADVLERVDRLTANANTIPDWFYRKVWRRKTGTLGRAVLGDGGAVLLFVNRQPIEAELCARLTAIGLPVVTVRQGSCFAALSAGEYSVNPRDAGDYAQLVRALAAAGQSPTRIVQLWGLNESIAAVSGDGIDEAQITGAVSAASLARALAADRASTADVMMLFAANGTARVQDDDAVAPEKATAIGILKSLPQELAWLRCRHVDIGASDPRASAAAIVDELCTSQDDREVAWRDGRRYVAGLEKVTFARNVRRESPFVRGGAYLIAGGAGGIGELVAEHLLTRYGVTLLIVGRRALEGNRLDVIRTLREHGGDVAYEAVDICDEPRLAEIVGRYTTQWGRRLDGVIHLAGSYDERLVADETAEHLLSMLRPKTRGTLALHRLLERQGGGVLIASSSIAGFFGGASIGAYAAANAFQHAFAESMRGRSAVTHACFSWSNWSGVGQSRGFELKDSRRARGYYAMAAEQALQSLAIGLACGERSLLVGLDSANRHVRRHVADAADLLERPVVYYASADGARVESTLRTVEVADRFGRRSLAEIVRVAAIPTTASGEIDREELVRIGRARDDKAGFVPPRTDAERRLAETWKALLGVSTVGRHDDFFDRGGDSLLAARLVAAIHDQFGSEVSLRTIFDAPTLAELAAVVGSETTPSIAEDRASAGGDTRPLTPGQRALWILHQMAPRSAAYNIAFTARIVSPVDAAALSRAFAGLVDRHEALRTIFPSVQGEPVQRVHATVDTPFAVIDGSAWSPEVVLDEMAQETKRPFDLAAGPLLRVRLFTHGPSDAYLTTTFHHIVMDGWSLWVCLSELGELYRAARAGESPRLPPVEHAVDQWAHWQAAMPSSAEGARHLSYWKEQLGAAVPVVNVPSDRPRPPVPRFRGASEKFRIDRGTTEQLKRLARDGRATPQMGLLALFAILLRRYTGQDDLMIGYLSSGRSRPELESIVGYLANLLPLKISLPQTATFGEALRQTRDTLLGALDHEAYPFSLLVDRLGAAREASRSPLFQVLFVYERPQRLEAEHAASFIAGVPGARMALGDLTLESLTLPLQQEGQFDLTLMVVEVDGQVCFTIDYNTDLFDRTTIRRMGDHLRTLADAVAAEPARSTSTLPLLTGIEHAQLHAWNDVALDHGRGCVHQMIEAHAIAHAAAPAVVSGSAGLTYAELNARANRLARYLADAGVTCGTPVGLLFDRASIDLIVAVVAVWKAGGAFLALDPAHPAERLRYMCDDSGAPVLVTEQALVDAIPAYAGRVVAIDRDATAIDRLDASNVPVSVGPHDLAYIIYTSGSTGRPKGVLLEHHGLWNVAREQQRVLRPGLGARVLQFASLSFDAWVFEAVMALGSGASLHLASRESLLPGVPLLQTLKREGITNLTIPPSALANLPLDPLPALDTLMVAGEACTPELIASWAPGRRFFNLYGPTEVTIWATYAECADGASVPPIGRPVANTQVHVLDANLQELPVGVPGELYLGGTGLARGYVNQPELTTARFIASPFTSDPRVRLYRTGDIVRRGADGQLYYLGRADSQIKLRGFRIELEEIEAALSRQPDVKQAVVVVRDEWNGNRLLIAYVVLRQPTDATALKTALRAQLPDYMVPSAFVVMDAFPVNASGKIDRAALPLPERTHRGDEAYTPPAGDLQERIAGIWTEVLGVDRIGADDNFFDLGGNSFLVARVHARLSDVGGSAVSIVDMFQFPTVRALAAHLDRDPLAATVNGSTTVPADALIAGRARLRDQQARRRGESSRRLDGSR